MVSPRNMSMDNMRFIDLQLTEQDHHQDGIGSAIHSGLIGGVIPDIIVINHKIILKGRQFIWLIQHQAF